MTASEKTFLDSNIIVYAYDLSDPVKMQTARKILSQGCVNENIVLSAQVLGEFFVVATRRILNPLSSEEALEIIEILGKNLVVDIDYSLVLNAVAIQKRYTLSYWDALIIAAAERAGCTLLLTEDLNHTQVYNDVAVINPFLK